MVKHKRISLFDCTVILVMLILAFIVLFPIWSTIVMSFISEDERLRRGLVILYPQKLDFSAYISILKPGSSIYLGYAVTLFRATVGTVCNMIVTTMLAYALSKKDLPGRKIITLFIYFTMLFNGGMVPTFLVVKYLRLYNTLLAYVLPGLISAWNLFLMRNFFMQLPIELNEAAIIDGASPLNILIKIVLPISIPSLLTIALLYTAWHWNSWYDGLLYIQNRDLLTLQNVLRNTINAVEAMDDMYDITVATRPPLIAVRSAMIVLSTIPILFFSTFVQKYFIKGMTLGSIKG